MRVISNLRNRTLATFGAAILAGSLLTASNVSATIIVLDAFTDVEQNKWPVELNQVGIETVFETGLSGVYGGNRTSIIEATFIDKAGLDFMRVEVAPQFGLLDYNSTVGAEGNFTLLYDNLGGLDVSSLTDLVVDIIDFDYANNLPMFVTVMFDDGTNQATLNKTVNSAGAHSLMFDLSDAGALGVDLESLAEITVTFDPGMAADLRIGPIEIIPTPGALALLAIAGLVSQRRRRA